MVITMKANKEARMSLYSDIYALQRLNRAEKARIKYHMTRIGLNNELIGTYKKQIKKLRVVAN
jgi:hypothetical protein